ncbi:Calx-beta domain-containing protein [Hymenobacter metallilatus]|uniref:T9SS C-terminal target domain-containing protein n=1 Tax=Hymenobacter metallilatus TaxID=2493666 RepID=A0A428JRB6_9BACT|nr:Calx-beta domain-containing protein [Hymenobacter metallilatus]RSK36129.1 T9SS C-terminal target domain-containing protein [Hymenobacter metallilatus]
MKHSYSCWWQRMALLAALGGLGSAAQAQTPVPFTGTAYTQNFDGFTPAGTTYPDGWSGVRLAGSGTANAVLTPMVLADNSTGGGTYNAGPNAGTTGDTDRALGSLASGSTAPAFGAAFINQSGAAIAQLTVTGRAEQWRTSSNAAINESLAFEYSTDATSLFTGTWTAVSALDITEKALTATTAGPLNGNDAANSAAITATFPISWAAGSTIWIRWKDTDNTGSDALLALDDFTLARATVVTAPTVSFGSATATAAESAGTLQIPVTLSAASTQALTVQVALATPAGTATSPSDYTFTTQTLTFPAGTTTQNATITLVDDAVFEPSETVILSLQNVQPTGAAIIGSGTYTLTITDNDVAPVSPIATLTVNDANGVPTLNGQTVSARGTVYGTNLRTAGYQITLIDNTGGIGLFASANIGTNTLAEGDSVEVTGTLGQFNGLTQINLTGITPKGRARRTYSPRVITTALTENEESELIRIPGPLTSVDPAQWVTTSTASGYNVDVTGPGGVTYQLRIYRGTTLYNTPAPAGPFSVTGIGSQFDSSSPYTEGYQIAPRSLADITLKQREPAFARAVVVYPNPAANRLTVVVGSLGRGATLEIFNALGQRVQTATVAQEAATVEVSALQAGVYSVRLTTKDGSVTRSFVKQ